MRCQRRENSQTVSSAGKPVTGAKRWKHISGAKPRLVKLVALPLPLIGSIGWF